MKTTPFTEKHISLGAKMHEFVMLWVYSTFPTWENSG